MRFPKFSNQQKGVILLALAALVIVAAQVERRWSGNDIVRAAGR